MPTSSAISLRLVPAKPCWAKRRRATCRMTSFVVGSDDAGSATRPAYRLVGSTIEDVSVPHFFAALLAAFLVTQLAIVITSVYLHRALSHRALSVHPAV